MPGQKDQYVLTRGYLASSRLNLQQYLWLETLGFNLHPNVPKPHQDARIADVATGTGLWLLNVAKEVPATVRLDGFDISLSQAPPQEWLAPNITLRTWDIFEDPPKDIVGQYDIVHVRLVLLVIRENKSIPVIKNLLKLLKPGGYIQWDELSTRDTFTTAVNSSCKLEAFDQLRHIMASHNPNGLEDLSWVHEMPATLNENGFQEPRSYQYLEDVSMAKAWNNMFLASAEEFVTASFKGTDKLEKMYDLVGRAYEETQKGAAFRLPKAVCVAQKPT